MEEFPTKILVEVPVVSHQCESTPRTYSVIDLKVLENSEQWFWNRQEVEVTSIVDGDIFEAIQDGKSVVLRLWASPEVRFGKVRGLIKLALQGGVSQVDLVMKNEIGMQEHLFGNALSQRLQLH